MKTPNRNITLDEQWKQIVNQLYSASYQRATHPLTRNPQFTSAVNRLITWDSASDLLYISYDSPVSTTEFRLHPQTHQFVEDIHTIILYFENMAGIIEITPEMSDLLEQARTLADDFSTGKINIIQILF